MSFGKRVKQAREKASLSQEQLAALCNLKQQSISKIEDEQQEGSTKTLAIAKACRVNPFWLQSGEGDMSSYAPGAIDDEVVFLVFQALKYASQEFSKAKPQEQAKQFCTIYEAVLSDKHLDLES
jgi:transcriptional regulator with XRE-family HTH domain